MVSLLWNVHKEALERIPNVRIVQKDAKFVVVWILVPLLLKVTSYLMVSLLWNVHKAPLEKIPNVRLVQKDVKFVVV